MRIVYMGTPDFAVPTLAGLVRAGHKVTLVVTQPDRPKGRGRKLTPPPVKVEALRHDIPVIQPVKLSEEGVFERVSSQKPDAIVLVAYGGFLKKRFLELPPLGCVNAHASLLPRHRGAAPIGWAILRGDKVTGVTTMQMDEGMDTGDILLTAEIPIGPLDTRDSLTEKLSHMAADLTVETLAGLAAGAITPVPQDDALATYAPKLMKEDGRIEWFMDADKISLVVRAFDPWPGAFTTIGEDQTKILSATSETRPQKAKHGEVLSADKKGILVACGKGALRILELQPPGKKRMTAAQYLAGRKIEPGLVMGA